MAKRSAGSWRNEVLRNPPRVDPPKPVKPLPGQLDLFQPATVQTALGKRSTTQASAASEASLQHDESE